MFMFLSILVTSVHYLKIHSLRVDNALCQERAMLLFQEACNYGGFLWEVSSACLLTINVEHFFL